MRGCHHIEVKGDRVYRYFNRVQVPDDADWNGYAQSLEIVDVMSGEGICPPVLYAGPTVDHGHDWPNVIAFKRMTPLVDCFNVRFNDALDKPQRQTVAAALAEKLGRLHALGWAHRDLHTLNVVLDGQEPFLIDWEWATKVTDFGPYDLFGPQVGLDPPRPHRTFGGMFWSCDQVVSIEKLLGPFKEL